MQLTPTQLRTMEALERGATIDEVIEWGLVSRKTILRWDVQSLREAYRQQIAPPRLNIARELDRLAPEAIQAVTSCLRGTGKQTQLLAARFVLEAAMQVEADADSQSDAAVQELRNVLQMVQS